MGYLMYQIADDFFISKDNLDPALEAIKNCKLDDLYWVHSSYLNAETFNKAMIAWRWDVHFDNEGNVDGISFNGQNLGCDDVLFRAIAKYVRAGSYIEMRGEDNSLWRYVFNGETCREIYPKIIWDES